MPTLHMDVEQTRSVLSAMTNTLRQMFELSRSMSGKVTSLQAGSWKGPSAAEFQNQYDQVKSQLEKSLMQIAVLHSELRTEMDQWERTGSKFG